MIMQQKFEIDAIRLDEDGEHVFMRTAYDNDSPIELMPSGPLVASGSMEFKVQNPDLLGVFRPGKKYMIKVEEMSFEV